MADEAAWVSLGAAVTRGQERLVTAHAADEFQMIGLICREALISLAQTVWIETRHPIVNPPANGAPVSSSDAKRKLESYVAAELAGSSNEEFRRFAWAACNLASKLVHERTANFANAARCLEALVGVINLVAITEGRCSSQRPWEITRNSVSLGRLTESARVHRDDIFTKTFVPGSKWPVPIAQAPLAMMHIYPAAALAAGFSLDPERLEQVHGAFTPARTSRWESRPTLDGWLLWQPRPDDGNTYPYHLAKWLSFVDNCSAGGIVWQIANPPGQEGAPIDVDGIELQGNLVATIDQIANGYRELGVSGTAIISISLSRVLNLRLTRSRPANTPGIDRPFLHLPDIRLADLTRPQADELKPSFDALWRAAGWSSGSSVSRKLP